MSKRLCALGVFTFIAGAVAPASAQHSAAATKPAEPAAVVSPQPSAAALPPPVAEPNAPPAPPANGLAPAYPPAPRARDDYRGREDYRARDDDYRDDDYRETRAERRERRARERYDLRMERERHPRRSRGMLIAGIALLAGGYVPPAFIGVAVGTQPRDKCDCRDALRLMIPLVGPLTLWKPDHDFNVFFNGLMLIDAMVQTAGLALTIFGAIQYADSAQEPEYGHLRPAPKPALSFAAAPTPGGLMGSLRLQL